MASYYFAYYTWVGKSLYLDDLYVKASCRGNKIGSRLLKQVVTVAAKEDCKRLRWQVSHWNKPAIAFYKKIGSHIDEECANCDFDVKAVQAFNF